MHKSGERYTGERVVDSLNEPNSGFVDADDVPDALTANRTEWLRASLHRLGAVVAHAHVSTSVYH